MVPWKQSTCGTHPWKQWTCEHSHGSSKHPNIFHRSSQNSNTPPMEAFDMVVQHASMEAVDLWWMCDSVGVGVRVGVSVRGLVG